MDPIKSIKLRWLQGALHDITYELSRSQFSRFAPQAWQPAINAYRCDTCIRICVDLAGVDRSLIDLTVEPRRLVIRGTRELPEPTGDEGCAQQLLAMEIDYGPFEREITFPVDVEIDKAHAEQRNGLLWISLPVRKNHEHRKARTRCNRARIPSQQARVPSRSAWTKAARRKFRKSCRFCQCAVLSFFRARFSH